MTDHFRYIWQLLVLASTLVLAGIFLLPLLAVAPEIEHFLVTVASLTTINLFAWIVLARAIKKNNREGAVIMLFGISAKFLLYLVYILVFWLLTKNISKPFIITFFALYLLFTFLLAGHLFNLLKNK